MKDRAPCDYPIKLEDLPEHDACNRTLIKSVLIVAVIAFLAGWAFGHFV